MPYKDKSIKREYQREWLKRKLHLFNKDGSQDVGSALVTQTELKRIDASVKSLSDWTSCVSAAKDLVFKKRRLNVLILASVCLKACEIKHGGSRKPGWEDARTKLTIKEFAKEAGINPKAMSDWIFIKKKIAEKVDVSASRPFDIALANNVIRHSGCRQGDTALKSYEFYSEKRGLSKSLYILRHAQSLLHYIATYGLKSLSEADRKRFHETFNLIKAHVED